MCVDASYNVNMVIKGIAA